VSTAHTIYKNLEVCAIQTGIPERLLAAAQFHPTAPQGTNGFHPSGRIHWDKLKPWFDEHLEEIKELASIPVNEWDDRRKRALAIREELAALKEKGEVVEREKVHGLLRRISAAQCSLFNSKFRQELPEKLVGKSLPDIASEIDRKLEEVFGLLSKEVEKWK
jgi:hypothetical protein